METAFQEALNLILRWLHVLAAIMWIGDSFLFMWMDSHLEKPSKPRDGGPDQIVGELWMTHSGGFYEVVKRKYLSQQELPKNLYWFKWESYTTWITGFLLLFVVYYMSGAGYLIDPAISNLKTADAILVSFGLLIGGWVVYDLLWSSPLGKRTAILAPLCFVALVAVAFALTQMFSGRAAYLQTGAMMGTIMSANVFFRIIPAQKYMLAATRAGQPVDTTLGLRAKTRSRHNHYMTLPVLFCMLSNHFPSTFSAEQAWLVLAVVFLFGAGLKYLMNYRGRAGFVVWAGTLVSLVLVIVMTSGRTLAVEGADEDLTAVAVTFPKANRVIQARCTPCHSQYPTLVKSPPSGIVMETPEQIAKLAPKILNRVWTTKTMPPANQTGIEDAERRLVAAWIVQGAKLDAEPRWEGVAPPPEAIAQAEAAYAARCAVCHGAAGAGDGPAAAGIVPRPTNLRDAAWHAQISDDDLRLVVLKGGPARNKSATMPPSLDLEDQPALLAGMVHVIRGFEERAPAAKHGDRSAPLVPMPADPPHVEPPHP